MSLRFVPRSGPLARLAARITAASPHDSAPREGRGSAPPAPDPAVQLGRLVDLAGSVKLSRVLARKHGHGGAPCEPAPASGIASSIGGHEAIATARRRVSDEIEEIEADARAVIARVLRRKDDARTTELRLADESARAVSDARARIGALRRAIGVDLASTSSEAARVERLVDAIDEAIDAQVEARIARIVPAIASAHAGDVVALVPALGGAISSVVAFERRRIDALVDACAELAVDRPDVTREEALSA